MNAPPGPKLTRHNGMSALDRALAGDRDAMVGGHPWDFRNPDYIEAFKERSQRLVKIRKGEIDLNKLKLHYRFYPADFINDWGMTFDPRNIEDDRPALIPFILMPKQREWIDWTLDLWKSKKSGITEKSRDMGLSWLMLSTACALCLHYQGMSVGFGSRKQEYVDRLGDSKSLFHKGRVFVQNLPIEFRPGWSVKRDAPHMQIRFPNSQSEISGEAGDNIGRGDRKGIYFTDEDAYIEHPELVDAALSNTTNCRISVSSVNGMANTFAIKRHSGKLPVFTFHWRDDPRKDAEWYAQKVEELDPVIVAQEIDIDYTASIAGALIPSAWVQASIDAHLTLEWGRPTGQRVGALDVADEGKDLNGYISSKGAVIDCIEEWSGRGSDIYITTLKAWEFHDSADADLFRYDADGLGSGVRAAANRINEARVLEHRKRINVDGFHGSGSVLKPDLDSVVKGRKNEDFFMNRKAQAYWELRNRFEKVWRAVTKGHKYPIDEMVSISSGLKLRAKLVSELSQPQIKQSQTGKIIIDKTPDGARSPNLADGAMMAMAGGAIGLVIPAGFMQKSRQLSGMAAAMAGRR